MEDARDVKLPDLNTGSTPSAPSELGQLANEQRRFGSVISEGLTAYGQELVKAQTQQAAAKLTEQLGAAETRIKSSPFVPASYLKEQFGEDLAGIQDPGVRQQVMAMSAQPDPKTGDALVPTWVVAGSLYDKHAKAAIQESSKGITAGQGWQAEFQGQVAQHVAQRKNALNDEQMRGMDEYLKQVAHQTATSFVNAGAYPEARQVVLSSRTLDATEKAKAFQAIDAAEQTTPIYDALRTHDVAKERELLGKMDSMSAIPAQHRETLAKQLEHDIKTVDLADNSRKEVEQLLAETGGDAAKAATLAKRIPDTGLYDAVDARLKKQVAEEHAMRVASDSPRVARLEAGVDRYGALDRTSKDFAELSVEGRAAVEAKYRANMRSRKAEGSEERRQQNMLDATAKTDFDALPLEDRVKVDTGEAFPNVSPAGASALKARQRKAIESKAADNGVAEHSFREQVSRVAQGLGYKPKTLGKEFVTYMLDLYQRELEAKPGTKTLPPARVKELLAEAILQGDEKGGSMWSRDKPAWQKAQAGEPFVAFPEQPPNVKAALEKLRGGAPPPAATGAQVPSEKLGLPAGGVFEMQPNGKYKRVK